MDGEQYIPVEPGAGEGIVPRAVGRNPRYAAAMLSNMSGACSELSSVSLYLYNRLVTTGVPPVAEVFTRISLDEMRHLQLFGALVLQLGADPRFWSLRQGRSVWWSPDGIQYTRKLVPLLHNALYEEQAALRKYESQTRWIRDPGILEVLHTVMEDERRHVEQLRTLCQQYGH